jgi:hypothetical protein
MSRRSETCADAAARLLKQTKALHLRAHGHTLRSIAQVLECAISTAKKLVDDAAAEERKSISRAKADLVELELIRCDTYLRALMKGIQSGNMRAIETALHVGKRRADLLGLDAPVRQEIAGPEQGPIVVKRDLTQLSMEDLDALEAVMLKLEPEA